MFVQDLFVKYYDYRPFDNCLLNKFIGNLSKMLRYLANFFLPLWFKAIKHQIPLDHGKDVVVCMTSFPARINAVWLVIECIIRQTIQPDQVVLYLARDQFPSEDSIPDQLRSYSPFVDIRLVDNDIKSHKKYWYATEDFPDKDIILIDDDIIYDSQLMERLIKGKTNNPHCVVVSYGHTMQWKQTGELKPYSEWSHKKRHAYERQDDFFFGSGGGSLFPAGSLKKSNLSLDILMNISPSADDVWLNAFVRVSGYGIVPVRPHNSCPTWINKNKTKLKTVNVENGQNDIQIRRVREFCISHYKIDPFDYHAVSQYRCNKN